METISNKNRWVKWGSQVLALGLAAAFGVTIDTNTAMAIAAGTFAIAAAVIEHFLEGNDKKEDEPEKQERKGD